MSPTLDVRQTSPHVAEVWLNRPDLRNAFNSEVIAELTAAFRTLAAPTRQLRAIVLGGPWQGLLRRGRSVLDAQHGRLHLGAEPCRRQRAGADAVDTVDLPCAGGVPHPRRLLRRRRGPGRGLRRAGGRRRACTSASAKRRLGLLPATIGPYVVRAMGEQAARRYFITAERFSAARAAQLGFVHEVVPAERLDAQRGRAGGRAGGQRAGRRSRPASGWCRIWPAAIDAALRDDTARRIADIRASAEGREGVSSPS
jgi:methylglutaconyl-CoA hydratase